MGVAFNYTEAFKALDLNALKKVDMVDEILKPVARQITGITGHFIRMAWVQCWDLEYPMVVRSWFSTQRFTPLNSCEQ